MKLPFKLPFKLGRGNEARTEKVEVRFRAEPLAGAYQGDLLEKYVVDQATVFIVDNEGKGFYMIGEPPLTKEEQRIYSLLMENLYYSLRPIEAKLEEPFKYVESFIWEVAEELGVVGYVQKSFPKYKYYIMRDAFGYGPIHVPMMDPEIEEISATNYANPVAVIHRRHTEYDWLETNINFGSEDVLRSFNQRLAQRAGKSITVAVPFVDAMTKEGHRLAVTFAGEVTLPGSTFCIRKFPQNPLSMAHLLKFGTLTPLMAAYLWLLEEYKGFLMAIGPMSSGKSTTLNALLTMIDPTLKISTIEDIPELRIPHKNWQRFKSRHTYSITESKFDVGLLDLVKLGLRYRPDYLVVGEVRGEEIRALVQASSLGHGCGCSLHAESPEAALVRMRSPPMDVSEGGLMLIWCFITLNRVKKADGTVVRRVLQVTETEPKEGKLSLRRIFTWDARTDTFSPGTAEEVVEKSFRLGTVKTLTGWTDEELVAELNHRAEFLSRQVKENKLSYPEFSEAVRRFYISRRRRGEAA